MLEERNGIMESKGREPKPDLVERRVLESVVVVIAKQGLKA